MSWLRQMGSTNLEEEEGKKELKNIFLFSKDYNTAYGENVLKLYLPWLLG
jgi:hypothetical protein